MNSVVYVNLKIIDKIRIVIFVREVMPTFLQVLLKLAKFEY